MTKAMQTATRKPNNEFLRKGKGGASKTTHVKDISDKEEEICIAIPLKGGKIPVSCLILYL